MAADEGGTFFCLPPHATHLLQPLDNGTLSSLKANWMQECQQFYTKNPGKVVTRRNFMQIFQPAWVKGMAMSNVIGCVRAAGVYPVDRRVVLMQLETPGNPPSLKPTPFVPFCTPRRNTSIKSPPHTPFSRVEMEYFHSRLKESTDARYALWLQTFHPQVTGHATAHGGVLDIILRRPTPPAQRKPPQARCSAHVLTSEHCMQELQDREETKRMKQEEKERKRIERVERKKVKEASKTKGKD